MHSWTTIRILSTFYPSHFWSFGYVFKNLVSLDSCKCWGFQLIYSSINSYSYLIRMDKFHWCFLFIDKFFSWVFFFEGSSQIISQLVATSWAQHVDNPCVKRVSTLVVLQEIRIALQEIRIAFKSQYQNWGSEMIGRSFWLPLTASGSMYHSM